MKKQGKAYPLIDSGLYGLAIQSKLASLLFIPKSSLRHVATNKMDYIICGIIHRNGKDRETQTPKGQLRQIHERMKKLLERIIRPDYFYGPVRGRSNEKNVEIHTGKNYVYTFDIKSFFPRTGRELIYRCFRYDFRMSDEVSGLLCELFTYNGSLMTGSPASPLIAFEVHRQMYEELYSRCLLDRVNFTAYMDDITLSSDIKIPPELKSDLHAIIRKYGHKSHKVRSTSPTSGSLIITGIGLSKGKKFARPKHSFSLKNSIGEINQSGSDFLDLKVVSRAQTFNGIMLRNSPRNSKAYRLATARREWLRNLQLRIVRTPIRTGGNVIVSDDDCSPF